MSIRAAERTLILLNNLIENIDGLGVRELSRRLGYSPSTVQGLINALSAQRYVVQDDLTGRYSLGPRAVQLGLVALSRLEVRNVARPHMASLSRETGETAFLGIARGPRLIYIDKVHSDHPIRLDVPLGEDRPYNCTAVGKVLLAGFSNGEFERSINEVEALRAEIELVRERGWARDDQEYLLGMGCVAAPVYSHEGQVIAALNVGGPAERINEKFDHILEQVIAHATSISEELGYRGPPT
jgi:DNA-binding IclR family transcriptional regulator